MADLEDVLVQFLQQMAGGQQQQRPQQPPQQPQPQYAQLQPSGPPHGQQRRPQGPPQQQRPQQQRPQQQRPQQQRPQQQRRPHPQQQGGLRPLSSLQPSDVVDAVIVGGDESVASHVAQHLNTNQFADRAGHLGEQVVHSQDALAAHQQQLFAQGPRASLTAAAAASPSVATETNPLANEVMTLLRSPASVRQALIMSEIMKRPEF